MKMQLMRKIDWYVGVPVCYFLVIINKIKKFFLSKKNDEYKKILVIKFLGIGSIVLIAPTLRAIRDSFPKAEVYFLSFESNKGVVELIGLTDKNYFIKTNNIFTFLKSTIITVWQLRKENINIVFDLEFFSKFPLVMSSLINADKKAGFYLILEPWRKSLLDYHGYYNSYYHVKDIFLSLVYLVKEKDPYYFNFDKYISKYSLLDIVINENEKDNIKNKLKKFGWNEDKNIILINPNAGSELAPELKRLPKECFAELIKRINTEYPDYFICLVGSMSEREYVENIIQNRNDLNAINFAGETSLRELLCIFSISSIFITIDSGPMHLASLIKIPTISIFTAGVPILDGPLNDRAINLYKKLYCMPILTVYNGKQSELEKNKLTEIITADEIFKSVTQLIKAQ